MPTVDELKSALLQAHSAGDTKSAQTLSNAIRGMATAPQPQDPTQSPFQFDEPVQPQPDRIGQIKEAFTGTQRTTPEVEQALPLDMMPELNKFNLNAFKTMIGGAVSDDKEFLQIIQANYPDLPVREDEYGNVFITSLESGKEHILNPPGLDFQDARKAATVGSLFAATQGKGGVLSQMARSAGTQAAIEGTQAAAGGEFNPGQIGLAGATEAIVPGVVGAVKNIGQAGKGVVNMVRGVDSALSPAQQAVRSAESVGISPMTSEVIEPGFFGKAVQGASDRIPIAGTRGVKKAKQESRVQAVKDLFNDEGLQGSSKKTMDDLLEKHGADVTKYDDMKKEVITRLSKSDEAAPVTNTLFEIEKEIRTLQKNPQDIQPVINTLMEYRDSVKGKTLEQIEVLRKRLGNRLKDPSLASVRSEGEKIFSSIYDKGVREDMAAFIKEAGKPKDFTKWKIANKRLSNLMKDTRVNSLKSALNKGEATPGEIRNLLFPSEAKKSNVDLLYKGLTPEGRKHAKLAVMQEVLQKAGGIDDITPKSFTNQMRKMEKQTGVFFNNTDKKAFQGVIKALKLTKKTENITREVGDIEQLAKLAGVGALTASVGGPATGVGLAAIGGLTRLYESKPVRDLLLRINKVPKGKEEALVRKLIPLVQSQRQLGEDNDS